MRNGIPSDRNEGLFLATVKQAKADQTQSGGPADASSKKNDTETTSGTKGTAAPSESKDGATSSKTEDQKQAAFTLDINFRHGPSAPNGGSPAPNGGSAPKGASKGGSPAANGGSSASKSGSTNELQVELKDNLLKNVNFKGSGKFTFPTNGGKTASQFDVGVEVPPREVWNRGERSQSHRLC